MSDQQGSAHETGAHGWAVTIAFIFAFVGLLISIALYGADLGSTAAGGFTWGQWLVVGLHVVPVAAAWIYVARGR